MSTEPIGETKTDGASLLQRFTSSLVIKVDAAEETMAIIYLLRFSFTLIEVIGYHLKEDNSLYKANFHQWALNTGRSLCLDRACDLGNHCGYTDAVFGAAGLYWEGVDLTGHI